MIAPLLLSITEFAAVATEFGDHIPTPSYRNIVDAAAAPTYAFDGVGNQLVAGLSRRDESDNRAGSHRCSSIAIAGHCEGGIG